MTFHVYAHVTSGGIQESHAADTRWKCQKWINSVSASGRMTHWYFISKLGYYEAKKRYARS